MLFKSAWVICLQLADAMQMSFIFQANSSNEDTLLKHAQEENHFYSFSSYLYPTTQNHSNRKWLLAIGSKGRIRNASRVSPLHKSHQFQISNIRENSGKSDVKALVHLVEHRGKWRNPWSCLHQREEKNQGEMTLISRINWAPRIRN